MAVGRRGGAWGWAVGMRVRSTGVGLEGMDPPTARVWGAGWVGGEGGAEAGGVELGEGAHPFAGEAVGVGWRARDGVTGFDATFSSPKSVSVLFALGGAEVRAPVRAAHVVAVGEPASPTW